MSAARLVRLFEDETDRDRADEAYFYARDIAKQRVPAGEPALLKEPFYAYRYAADVIKGRWPEAEPAIANSNAQAAAEYAVNVVKGRWPEGEATIAQDPFYKRRYERMLYKLETDELGRDLVDLVDT